MPSVSTYWPGSYWAAMNAALAWLYGRQGAPASNWLANALLSQGASMNEEQSEPATGLVECGIASQINYLTGLTLSGAQDSPFALTPIESITLSLPAGYYADNLLGTDGYPINQSGQPLAWGSLLVNSVLTTLAMENQVRASLFNSSSVIVTPGQPATGGVIAKWTKNTLFAQFQMIVDSNDNVQMALYSGVTANTSSPPNWPTGSGRLGALTGDGTQVWKFITQNYAAIGPVATGYVWNLLLPQTSYRVDVFSNQSGTWYYEGSSALQTSVLRGSGSYTGPYTFSVANVSFGQLLAVLYPTTVSQPATGWSGAAIPAGWVSHTNTGVCQYPQVGVTLGGKLSAYKAQVYTYNGTAETLVEDNIPIVVQSDGFHARAGSSVYLSPAAGVTPTVHICYNDPVAGWTEVYSSLQSTRTYEDLPRSYDVSTNDPLYVANPVAGTPAMQNRSTLYDCALAIMAYCQAGKAALADEIIQQLNSMLLTTGAAVSQVLENGTGLTGGIETNWTTTGGGPGAITVPANSMTPELPPAGRGSVQMLEGGARFVGPGLPSTDNYISLEFMIPSASLASATSFVFTITNAASTTYTVTVTVSMAAGAAFQLAYGPSVTSVQCVGTAISVEIAINLNTWQTLVLNLSTILAASGGGTFASVTGIALNCVVGPVWFTNLNLGLNGQALSVSYDAYGGEIDQQAISTGAMAWICYAYAVYMQVAQDYSSWPQLQSMLAALLAYQSTAGNSTAGLFYQGNGSYNPTTGAWVPGPVLTCSMQDQAVVWFALMRCAVTLQTVVTQLNKGSQISTAQANSLSGTLASCVTAAETLAAAIAAVLYIAPAGSVPGHFANGVTGSTVDPSESCDANVWGAIWADGYSTYAATPATAEAMAEQAIEFAWSTFSDVAASMELSSAANTYNETYALPDVGLGINARPMTVYGMKPFSDSAGGFSGSPVSVSSEATWGMVLALLRLYYDTTIQAFFTGLGMTIDEALTLLIAGQQAINAVPGNGSQLMATTAYRTTPVMFDLYVWPAVAPTAWMWLTAINPQLLLTVAGQPQLLPYMIVPSGAEQSIDELNGSSSVGQMEIHCIDPGGVLHTLAAQEELIGQIVSFSLGFPGMQVGDFVSQHVLQIAAIEFDQDGRVILRCNDIKRFVQGAALWVEGGPDEWLPGQKNTWQPVGAQWIGNGEPISSDNPRYVQGNPLDILLAALQNELGCGQDPALQAVVEENGSGEMIAAVNPYWKQYLPAVSPATGGNAGTLINPNQYLDVAGITALRDSQFSGDWFEFKITSPQQGRSWLEEQICKPLGLVMVVTSTGLLTLKAMKNPADQTPVAAFTNDNIVGIPSVRLAPIVNALSFRGDVDTTTTNISARTYNSTVCMFQQESYNLFQYLYNHQVEVTGLTMGRGLSLRSFLLGDQIFRRWAFATPTYEVTTQLGQLQPELKDWVSLTHPLVPDYIAGGRGVSNIPCEIVGRAPDYANARVRFTLLDMRRASTRTLYEIALSTAGIPAYASATAAEQETYFFISPSSASGAATQTLSTIF